MTRSFTPSRRLLFFPVIFFLAIACNSGTGEKAGDKNDTTSTGNSVSKSALPTAGLISGKLDSLYAPADSFLKLPAAHLVVFVFTFRENDTLTLHGWASPNGSSFGDNPDIQLAEYAPDPTLTYSNGMYFGNVVLKAPDVEQIKRLIRSNHAKTVLFAPKLVNTTHIGYDIFLSNENPAFEKVLAVIPTGTGVNPSPPKSY